ncbi:adenylate/guanylate cyclase domain-containing protein [Treponema phagedenis]|uniref:adenylate/guanylate cyclase domain-containing protein n=1 Tax=Treponema phagedenis TaxID=162 RepID=UPI001EE7609C|nr:adenylate/guanylate cyclase domain-containing protein [Treponema phagedenis]
MVCACIHVAGSSRNLFYPHIVPTFFPNLSWYANFILRYVTVPLPVILFTVFIRKALKLCYKIPYVLILSVSIVYAVSTLVLPPEISSQILIYYQIFMIFGVLYTIYITVIGLIKKKEFSGWIFSAIIILFLFGIYDLLVALKIIPGRFLIHVASIFPVLLLSVMVLNDYAGSIKKIQDLTEEMQLINKSLVRFVPEQIITLLQKKSIRDVKLGDNVELTMPILSIDIRSFTHTSEKLSPNQVFDLLNRYFTFVSPIVREYNGIITKYLGDGFFALFPDGVDAALAAGIKIQKALQSKNIMLPNTQPLRIGVGIDMGNILLGTIGDTTRMDSIIISNAYYIAEILQESTKKYSSRIIISDRIFASLTDPTQYFIRPVEKIKTISNKENFLFEVYDCDEKTIRDLKYHSQGYIEHAIQALSDKGAAAARKYIDEALKIYPNDHVALYYKKEFLKQV